MNGITKRWEGGYLVRQREMHEYRYIANVHVEMYHIKTHIDHTSRVLFDKFDCKVYGDWLEDQELAELNFKHKIRRDFGTSTYEISYEPQLEERDRVFEISRIHRSDMIICSGHFLPSEKRPAFGGWDLH